MNLHVPYSPPSFGVVFWPFFSSFLFPYFSPSYIGETVVDTRHSAATVYHAAANGSHGQLRERQCQSLPVCNVLHHGRRQRRLVRVSTRKRCVIQIPTCRDNRFADSECCDTTFEDEARALVATNPSAADMSMYVRMLAQESAHRGIAAPLLPMAAVAAGGGCSVLAALPPDEAQEQLCEISAAYTFQSPIAAEAHLQWRRDDGSARAMATETRTEVSRGGELWRGHISC